MTLQLNPALEQRLESLAAQTHRSPEELAEEGMDLFLAHRESLELAVQQGRAAAQQGDLIDHEEAMFLMDEVLEKG